MVSSSSTQTREGLLWQKWTSVVSRSKARLERRRRERSRSLKERQSIASAAWDEVADEYGRRVEPFTSLFVPCLLDPEGLKLGGSGGGNGCVDGGVEIRRHRHRYHHLRGRSVLYVAAGFLCRIKRSVPRHRYRFQPGDAGGDGTSKDECELQLRSGGRYRR